MTIHPSYLFHIPLTCTYLFTFSFRILLSLFTNKGLLISSLHINSFKILIHVHRKSSKKREKRKRTEKNKKKGIRIKRKKENKLRECLLFFHPIFTTSIHPYHLSSSSTLFRSIIIISGIYFFTIHFFRYIFSFNHVIPLILVVFLFF